MKQCNMRRLKDFVYNEDFGKLGLRISISFLMLFHGYYKLQHGVNGIKMLLQKVHLPDIIAYGSLLGECVIPIALILGFYTRLSAFILSTTMFFAIVLTLRETWYTLNPITGGLVSELPLVFLFTSLCLIFLGAGKYSLDYKMRQV